MKNTRKHSSYKSTPIKTPTHTTNPTPQTQPIMKHTSVIALPTKICKQYEVGGGQYDG